MQVLLHFRLDFRLSIDDAVYVIIYSMAGSSGGYSLHFVNVGLGPMILDSTISMLEFVPAYSKAS